MDGRRMSRIYFDEYRDGRAAFQRGDGILSIAERLIENDQVSNAAIADAAEAVGVAEQADRDTSYVLGFADALLDLLRANLMPPVEEQMRRDFRDMVTGG
jgi:hypothetical protein